MDQFSCNVCDHKQFETLYDKQVAHPLWWCGNGYNAIRLRYVMCHNCGYITLFPRLNFSEYAENYRSVPGLSRQALATKREAMLAERRAFLMQNRDEIGLETIVEIGPAYGDFLLLLPEFNRRIGIEPSATYCDYVTSSQLPLDYRSCMLEEIPQAAPELVATADVVAACHVLEHAENPRAFVRQMANLVNPGGCVFIEVPSVEAMAECRASIFQTLHFGHVSQFSVPALSRLCATESLRPLELHVSSRHDYPVIRALFRKDAAPELIVEMFGQHCAAVAENLAAARAILLETLHTFTEDRILLWGCGQDLFDVLDLLDESELAMLTDNVKLVDINSGKQGKKLYGLTVVSPRDFHSAEVEAIVVSSRSELIQADIVNSAHQLAPAADLRFLYPLH